MKKLKFMMSTVGWRFYTKSGRPLDKWEIIAMGYDAEQVKSGLTPIIARECSDWILDYKTRLHG